MGNPLTPQDVLDEIAYVLRHVTHPQIRAAATHWMANHNHHQETA